MIQVLLASLLFATSSPSSPSSPIGDPNSNAAPKRTAMLRYAVVVASNVGRDSVVGEMPKLQHAEAEARTLRDSLIKFASFDSSIKRTKLLTGATRSDLERAISELAAQIAEDKKTFGETRTMFAFFFTGHGLSERLLLADGPVYDRELAAMMRTIHADLTVGFIDACFSGSMAKLAEKGGVRSTPGLNVFRELPEEAIGAEGTLLFVSSAPGEASYEDADLGGVFTHFFIEALERAEPEGPGTTLDRIWTYAQTRTVTYTKARSRVQTPQQVVVRLRATAPLYFSFPRKRDATLVLSPATSGQFLLAYEGGELSEILHKEEGAPLELDVFSGHARLIMIGDPPSRSDRSDRSEESLLLAPGTITLIERSGESRQPQLGDEEQTLWEKGGLQANRITPVNILSLGTGYQYSWARAGILASAHRVRFAARWDADPFVASLGVGIGRSRVRFRSWGYGLRTYSAEARGGVLLRDGDVRVAFMIGLEATRLQQRYDDRDLERAAYSVAPVGSIEALIPVDDRWGVAMAIDGGVLISPGAGASAGDLTSPILRFSVMPVLAL